MIAKILFATVFAFCQAAHREPWWIQMFFPNVSFTGKYHPSNYKVEKSPLFPDYVQNPNDVWSPAYWMPYKLAYSQYWIDLIDNTTKAEQEKEQQAQAQTDKYGPNFGLTQEYVQNNQYYGQSSQDSQPGMNGQYIAGNQNFENNYNGNNVASQSQSIAEEASSLAQNIQIEKESMNAEVQQIVAQANQEAKEQMKAVVEEASKKKKEIAAEAQFITEQAEKVYAQIDQAAEAKVEAIAQEFADFQEDIKRRFEPIFKEADEITMEAVEIIDNFENQF